VGVWTPSFQFQHGFEATEDEPTATPLLTGGTRRGGIMVTDCVVMENCSKLVLSVTKRELQFHDIPSSVGTGRTIRVKLFDLPYVPLCLCYYNNSHGGPSQLLFGDENGDVHILTFANPSLHLFVADARKSSSYTPRISYNMLPGQSPHVLHQVVQGIHTDWVRRIQYLPDNHSIISCSSSQPSLVIKDLMCRQKPYVFRIRKGVECFAYDSDLPLLITGGMDHAVRLWNPYVTSKPVAYLQKHTSAVLDVLICRDLGLLFSFSQDGVLCAWDLYEHCLIQVIGVKFPFIQRQRDHGARSLCTGFKTKMPSLLVTSNEFLVEYELGIPGNFTKAGAVTTDSAPITSAFFSSLLSQVVVGSEASTVTVWDIDTGRKVLHFPHCHGDQEITCMLVDMGGRRFLTGSRYGEVKVWNSSTGECLKVLHHDHKTEVTGIVGINDRRLLLTVGWNKQVVVFPDDEDSFEASPLEGWETSGKHEDDILCVSYLPPRFLATSSFDGVIRVWNIENTQLVREFHSQSINIAAFDPSRNLRKASCVSFKVGADSSASSFFPSRPASRRVSTYKMRLASNQLKRSPVDKVLFLKTRGKSKLSGCGVLVSSDHGEGSFWDLFGSDDPLGSFPLTQNMEEHVMALHTDPRNRYLVAGDTAGAIAVFDIQEYCMVAGQHYGHPPVVSSWRAHSAEVTSVQYVDRATQPLVLSSSGDATVRLWTLQGHFIGTFGQETPWSLESPSTFQHPKTPWGEVHLTKRSASRMCKFFWDDDGDDDRNPTLMDSYVCVYCLCLMCTSHNAVVPYCSLYVCCTIVHCTHNNSIHALYLRATIEEVNSVMYVNVCSVQTL
jgi:WD40 repeat protein